MQIISRQESLAAGLPRYFTGKSCKWGHVCERFVLESRCCMCLAARHKKYREENAAALSESKKNHYEKNREKLISSRKKYYKANKQKCLETTRRSESLRKDYYASLKKKWYEDNKVSLAEVGKLRYENNKEAYLARNKEYYKKNKKQISVATKKYREENKAKLTEGQKRWYEKNYDKVRINTRNREERIKLAGGTHVLADIKNIFTMQRGFCAACYEKIKGKKYHVDHIKPIALGGDNWPSNLQILCPPCNMSKGAKPTEEFYAERGFLL